MAKKVSIKDQIYQSIVNSQVQQAYKNMRDQDYQMAQNLISQYQPTQDDYAMAQNLIAQYQPAPQPTPQPVAEPVKQATVNEVKAKSTPKTTQQIPSIADYFRPKTASGKDINKEAAKFINEERKKREAAKEEANKPVATRKPEQTVDYSSPVAARLSDKSNERGGSKWNKSVNDTLAMLNSQEMRNISRLPMPQKQENAVPQKWENPNYVAPIEVRAQQWLSPDVKLSDAEKKEAKAYASSELQKFNYGPNNRPLLKTDEERQHYADMVNLINKTSGLASAMGGFMEMPYNLAKGIGDAGMSGINQIAGLGAAVTDKLGLTEGATQRHNDRVEAANRIADMNEANMRQSFNNAQTQDPLAHTGGKIAGQIGMYALTNPAFNAIGGLAGGGKAAAFVANQVGQNIQDAVLDELPLYKEMKAQGYSDEEIRKALGKSALWNGVFNLGMGAVGEIPNIAKSVKEGQAARQAFTDNIIEGRKALDALINEDTDNIVRNATKQAEDAAQKIEDISKQMPEIPEEDIKLDDSEVKNLLSGMEPVEDISKVSAPEKVETRAYSPEEIKEITKYSEDRDSVRDSMLTLNRDTNVYHKKLYEQRKEYLDFLTEPIRKKYPELFDEVGEFKGVPKQTSKSLQNTPAPNKLDNIVKANNTSKYSADEIAEMEKYVSERERLLKENLQAFESGKQYSIADNKKMMKELEQRNRSINAMDGYMYDKYPELFDPFSGKFKGVPTNNVADVVEDIAKSQPATPKKQYSYDGGVDNPKLTFDQNDKINGYMAQIEDPLSSPRVNEALGDLAVNVKSDEGFKAMDDYTTLSQMLRETTDPAEREAFKKQLADIKAGLKNVDKAERPYVKQLIDFADVENAISDYKIALNGTDKAEVEAAKRALDSARNRLARGKNVDNRLKKAFSGSYGLNLGRPYNEFEIPDKPLDWSEMDNNYKPELEAPKKNYSIEEVNLKGGKKGYYVAEEMEDGTLRNVEPGKVYKRIEDANDAVYNLKYSEGSNKVMAEDTGLTPEPDEYKLTSDYEKPVSDNTSEYKIGEELDTPDNLKERGQSKHIRNAETPMRMDDVADEVVADFEKDPDMYRVLRNADTKARAEDIYNTSDNPEAAFRALLDKKDPASLPLGHQIAKDYSAAGNYDAAAQIYRDMGKALTESGQFSQAAIINMVKNDPMTALHFAQKEIDSLNAAGAKRFGEKWNNFKLTDDEVEAFKNVKAGDSDALKAIYKNIGERLGKEYPTTLWEKLIEARRVAMLFNPRTNVRNILANPPTLGMRWLSDRVEALGQNFAHLINPDIKVTQSLYGSGTKGRKIAKEAWESSRVQSLMGGSGSKADLPNLKNSLMENKQVFKGTPVGKWIDKVTDGGIQKANEKLFGKKGVQSVPETIRNATYKLLDIGDRPFVKENFIERLGSYISATGIKNIDDIPDEAIDMAWEEAMKATYKDNSWAVGMIRELKKGMEKADNFIPGLGTTLSQSTIPFVQAPGNIAARMADYSPVGASKGIAHIISGARKGNVKSVEKGIEEAAKGLTGSGLIYLGMKLKESGILTGTYSTDKDQKAFEKMNGFKEFAIHAGDQYFTYGWAQPFAQELMVGTLLQDAIDKSDKYDSDILRYYGIEGSKAGKAIGVAKEGTKAAINSWFNESPLSGFADLLKGNSYEKTDIAGNLWENGVSDFAGALIPSVVSASAKVADTTQRNTYSPDNAYASFINANIAKIPGLSKTLPAKYDTWGREMKYAKNAGSAALARYAVPGEYSYDKADEIDNEINRLFNEAVDSEGKLLQDNGVFPTVAPNKVGDKTLNNKEVSEYQKDMGQRSRTAVESFINSEAYKSMDDPEKIEVLKKIYGTSSALTKRDKFDTPLPDNSSYKKAVAAYDEAGGGEKGAQAIADYFSNKSAADKSGLSSQSDAYEDIQKDLASGNTKAAEQKIDSAKQITNAGIGVDGYEVYKARKSNIPSLDNWIAEYKNIDSLGNSDGFVNQDEFISAVKKNGWSEQEAVKKSKVYGNWKQVPYIKKDGTWGFHKTK